MRIKNLKTYYLRNRETIRDPKEGARKEKFADQAVQIDADLYDDSKQMKNTYGGIQYITTKVMLFDAPGLVCLHDAETGIEKYAFRRDADGNVAYIGVGDGVCVYVDASAAPDYRITSILHCGHLVCRLERI